MDRDVPLTRLVLAPTLSRFVSNPPCAASAPTRTTRARDLSLREGCDRPVRSYASLCSDQQTGFDMIEYFSCGPFIAEPLYYVMGQADTDDGAL